MSVMVFWPYFAVAWLWQCFSFSRHFTSSLKGFYVHNDGCELLVLFPGSPSSDFNLTGSEIPLLATAVTDKDEILYTPH